MQLRPYSTKLELTRNKPANTDNIMALKHKVSKAEFEKLVKLIQSEYKPDETGENYVLDVEGLEDTTALKTAKDRERDARKLAEQKAKEAQAQVEALTEERDTLLKGTIPKANVEALENSYKEKLTKREGELTGQIGKLTTTVRKALVDNVAASLASKISISPTLMLPHIQKRLTVEEVNGEFVTRVLDGNGAPSASTIADLEKEFLANKEFAPVLVGSKGSGGAGAGGNSGGAGRKSEGEGKIDFSGSPAAIAKRLEASGRLQMPPNSQAASQ